MTWHVVHVLTPHMICTHTVPKQCTRDSLQPSCAWAFRRLPGWRWFSGWIWYCLPVVGHSHHCAWSTGDRGRSLCCHHGKLNYYNVMYELSIVVNYWLKYKWECIVTYHNNIIAGNIKFWWLDPPSYKAIGRFKLGSLVYCGSPYVLILQLT